MDAPPPPQPPGDPDDPVAMAHYQNLLKKYNSDSLRRSRSAARNQNNTSPVSTLKPREILDAVDGNSEGIGATSASAMLDFADAGADDDDFDDNANDEEEEVEECAETTQKSTSARGRNFCSEEYLLLAKSFMSQSSDASRGTDQTSGHFWSKVGAAYNKLINQSNSVNSARPNYTPFPDRTIESLKGAWSRRLQKAVGTVPSKLRGNSPKLL